MINERALPASLREKYHKLRAMLRPLLADGLVIAYSGGVDSGFLVWAAQQEKRLSGGKLLAATAVSASLAQVEKDEASEFAKVVGVDHCWIESRELLNPDYVRNDAMRCYHCKTELFSLSRTIAETHGLMHIAYGYNASDRNEVRLGHHAALELGILAPLDATDLSKEEIRNLLRAFDLKLAEKPASPCLSSRLMLGVKVTPQKLKDIEELEGILRSGGVRVFRVRLHEEGSRRFLRLEVAADEMLRALECRSELVSAAKDRGYQWITLDLAGYRTGGGNFLP